MMVFRKGWAMIDTMIAVSMFTGMTASMAGVMNDLHERQMAVSVSAQINQIASPVRDYVNRNYATLASYVPSGSAAIVPLYGNPNWLNIGDVSTTSDGIPKNWTGQLPNGQKIYLVVRHYPLNLLDPEHLSAMLLTSGGSPMTDKQVGLASVMLNGMAGSIMKHDYGTAKSGQINGLAGAWSEQASQWTAGSAIPTYGHIALFLSGNNSVSSPYLNRYNIGNNEVNRLHTSIDVNSNDLNNIHQITGVNTLRLTGLANAVNVSNGVNLCESGANGCGISISSTGGFYDNGDGFITLAMASSQNGGLHITNGGLLVDGNGQFSGTLSVNGNTPGQDGPDGGCGLITGDTSLPACWGSDDADAFVQVPGTGGDANWSGTASGNALYIQDRNAKPAPIVADFFAPNSQVVVGEACGWAAKHGDVPANHMISIDATGNIASCVNGVWKSSAPVVSEMLYVNIRGGWGWQNSNISTKPHAFCALTYVSFDGGNNVCQVDKLSNGYWNLHNLAGWNDRWGSATCTAMCID